MESESESNDRRDSKKKRLDKHNVKKKQNNVCRDFLRSMCDRGAACKFEHPPDQKQRFSFCHDFQHGYCRRNKNCKFIHASYEDESVYLKTGQLPSHLINWYERQKSLQNIVYIQFCKKYLFGMCQNEDCVYKHVTRNEYRKLEGRSPSPLAGEQNENVFQSVYPYCKLNMGGNCWESNCKMHYISRSEFQKVEEGSPTPPPIRRNEIEIYDRRKFSEFEDKNKFRTVNYEPEIKRPFIVENERIDNISINGFDNSVSFQNRSQSEQSYIMLEEENFMLKERITELKKRIDDLQVTNEFLLEQNARLRLQQDKTTAGLTAMTVPAVTITNSVPGANQIQQNPTAQQMVTAALRTVAASVATVPVSISTVTPVSLGAVSMAPVQQMQGSVMTIAQQGAPSGEPQIAPQPLPMSISAPSVPLVSYPIVSHTVMQQPASLRHLTS